MRREGRQEGRQKGSQEGEQGGGSREREGTVIGSKAATAVRQAARQLVRTGP